MKFEKTITISKIGILGFINIWSSMQKEITQFFGQKLTYLSILRFWEWNLKNNYSYTLDQHPWICQKWIVDQCNIFWQRTGFSKGPGTTFLKVQIQSSGSLFKICSQEFLQFSYKTYWNHICWKKFYSSRHSCFLCTEWIRPGISASFECLLWIFWIFIIIFITNTSAK